MDMVSLTEKYILIALRAFGMRDDGISVVASMLRTPEAEEEMLSWMLECEPGSTKAVLNKAISLRQKYRVRRSAAVA
ncbi:MAG: hypothetical protein J5569_00800 [Oscillospiraceae bacterium]|nr:hypothetical protein [Oscillospiraceae bacterium]